MADRPVEQIAHVIPVSAVLLAEAMETADAMRRWEKATPEQRERWEAEARAARAAERAARAIRAEARAAREVERAAAEPVPLTLDRLLDTLGISEAEARHHVQPYCTCSDVGGREFWPCPHYTDEGLARD